MAKNEQLGVRVPADIKSALVKAAKADRRSASSLVVKILSDWLIANGWLKLPDSTTYAALKERREKESLNG